MSYEKFIKRDGRTYGPYIYESKRINGKVVSHYHGSGEKKFSKNFFIAFICILFLAFLIIGFFLFRPSMQGRAVLNLQGTYEKNNFNGSILLNVKQGELIPANSVLSIENNGRFYNYSLKNVVQQQATNGDYYVEGKNLSDSGSGYGFAGEKINYPEVYFKFNIISSNESSRNSNQTISNQTIYKNNSSENLSGFNESSNINEINNSEITVSSEQTPSDNLSSQTEVQTSSAPSTETTNLQPETPTTSSTEITNSQQETSTTAETNPSTNSEQTQTQSSNTENAQAENTAPVGVVASFLGFFQKAFLGFTGRAVSNSGQEIQGSVSQGNNFNYDLNSGETIQLVDGSVGTELNSLSFDVLNVKVENNKLTVSTNYSESSRGFGQNYISNKVQQLPIDFSSLGISLEKGDFNVKLIYNNQELASYSTTIQENFNNTIPATNETLNQTQVNVTVQTNVTANVSFYANNLTDKEKQILIQAFGNSSVVSYSKLFNGRIIVDFKIGNYFSDYSYDSNLSDDVINSLMEIDRINWLKDLANSLSSGNSYAQSLNKFNESFNLGENFSNNQSS